MSAENLYLVEQHLKAWSTGDVDAIVACFAEDGVFVDVAMGLNVEGRGAVRDVAVGFYSAATDVRWTPTAMFGDGSRVCTEWHLTWTQLAEIPGLPVPVGQTAEVTGVTVDEIHDGLITRHTDHWNPDSLGARPV